MAEGFDPTHGLWTGRCTFVLTGRPGPSEAIDLNCSREDVIVWLGGRTLAVIDRDVMREWLFRPHEPLVVDDLAWSVESGVTCLTLFEGEPRAVPAETVQQLMVVI